VQEASPLPIQFFLRWHIRAWFVAVLLSLILPLTSSDSFSQTTVIQPLVVDSLYGLPGLNPSKVLRRPKVGLVLSGGGARGMAQIGVLKALERHNIPIDMIAATSLGAVVGGLYASGYTPAEIESIAVTTNWDDVLSLTEETRRTELFIDQKRAEDRSFLLLRFDGLQPVLPPAVSSGQRLTEFLSTLTLQALYHPDPNFDALRIPFRAVSTDLISGKRVVLFSGSMAEALRASATVPLLFHPVERDGMELIDGGLLSNIPVDVVRNAGCDIVIAVNSTSSLRNKDELSAPWQTADQIMGIMMQLPNEIQLNNADIVITPDIGRHLSSDFGNIDSLIAQGDSTAESQIANLLSLLRSHVPSSPDDTVLVKNTIMVEKEGESISDSVWTDLRREIDSANVTHGDLRRMLQKLYSMGDYETVMANVSVDSSLSRIVINVKENPHVTSFIVKGAHAIPTDEVTEQMFSLYGKPFNYRRASTVMEDLLRLYRQRGYSLARVDTLSFSAETGDLRVVINEGIIHRLDVEGLTHTSEDFVLHDFPLEVGSLFQIDKAREGLTNIASTALFEYVYVEVGYDAMQPAITIRLKERAPRLVRFGLHADNERNLQALVDLRDENLNGAGLELGLTFSGGSRNREAALEFKANRIFNTYLTFNIGGFVSSFDTYTFDDADPSDQRRFERIRTGEYSEVRTGGRLVFGTQLERFGNLTAEFTLQNIHIKNIDHLESIDERYRLAIARFGTVIDSKNSYPFPTDGIGMKLSYEFAFQEFGGQVSYNALNFSWEAFTTFGTRHTLHPRLTFGFGDKTMPLSEQFRLGGLSSFFGTNEDDRRGRQLFLINFEYRYRLPFNIIFDTYLSARYDAASISLVPEEIKFNTLRHGFGLQLGLDTPLGLAAFAVGKSFYFVRDLPENPVKEGPFVFYFMVGYQL